jgi:hypothetical protein
MSDRLAEAARALYESRPGSSPRAAKTRAAIVERALRRKRRRGRRSLFLLPLAATFVLSSAWAAENGRLPALFARVLEPWRPTSALEGSLPAMAHRSHPPVEATDRRETGANEVTGNPQASAESTETGTAAPASSFRPASATPLHARPLAKAPAGKRTTSAVRGAAGDAEESAYARAHQAHFVDHDPAAALVLWDRYLEEYPQGRLALEARYDRALTLVRLGRMEEAKIALAPFADAPVGDYRQREARLLVEAIDAR